MCCFLSKTDVFIVHLLREFGIRETRYVNNRYAVVGDIAIPFYLILLKKASFLIPNLRIYSFLILFFPFFNYPFTCSSYIF